MRNAMTSLVAGTMITLATAGVVLAQQGGDNRYRYGPGMMWHDGYMGGYGMFFGPLFMILVLAAIIIGIVWLLRAMGALGTPAGASAPADTSNKALDILKERFAKGEIDAKEFDERKRLLSD